MTSRDIYIVGLRLLAVQFVVLGLASLPSGFLAFELAKNSGHPDALALALVSACGPLIMVFSGAAMAYRSRFRVDDAAALPESGSFFIVAIRLLGLWLGITGAASFVGAVADTALVSSSWQSRASELLSSALLLGAGWLLFARPDLASKAAK